MEPYHQIIKEQSRSIQHNIRALVLVILAASVVIAYDLFHGSIYTGPVRNLEHAVIKLPDLWLTQKEDAEASTSMMVDDFAAMASISQAVDAMIALQTAERNVTICRWEDQSMEDNVTDCLIKALPNYHGVNPNVVFLGDSTMARLWYRFYQFALPYHLPLSVNNYCNCQMRILDRCFNSGEEEAIYNKLPRSEWIEPNVAMGEGPTAYGLGKGKGCMDCRSCHSRMTFCSESCSYTPPSYFGVEFARDVSLQTFDAKTTQEATAALLRRRFQRKTGRRQLCVVNVGMHDFSVEGMTKSLYISNVDWYLTLIRPSCDHLLWVSLNYVVEMEKYPQNNTDILAWNKAVESLLQTRKFSGWTTVLDIFNVTSKWQHENPVHIEPNYYLRLALVIANAVLLEPGFID